ncbi:hypothetical protein [Marinobacter sp. CP1]|uniref:hypothetical protein n=1 Tax=Marinobacter sp. CP1 TaxID=1671721 RepID=UPI0011406F36|nr:hypothetical protein [Marinobacter sp. CP1]
MAPVSDPMAGGQQGKREAGSRYQGNSRAEGCQQGAGTGYPQRWGYITRYSSVRQLACSREQGTALR